MPTIASYLAGGVAIVLAFDFIAPPVGAGFIRAGLTASPASFNTRFDAAPSNSLYDVNRAAKRARLTGPQIETDANNLVPKQLLTPGAQRPTRDVVREIDTSREAETPPAKTPVGCDPAYSTLVRTAPARFAGRCMV